MLVKKNSVDIIGLMSGSSLDGLDVAWCRFEFRGGRWNYTILAANTYLYSPEWKERLRTLAHQDAFTYVKTHVEFGHFMGRLVKRFIKKYKAEADYISSHGHTVFHQPRSGITSQIGDGAALAATSGLNVICDFRSMDVALKGEGAPLVPVGDKLLFSDYPYCLNIGGIANISYDENNIRKAYDVTLANMALNYFAERKGMDYDEDGLLAQKGNIRLRLFKELNSLSFYEQNPPKSLGKEWFESVFLPVIFQHKYPYRDIMATIVEHIVYQIGCVMQNKPEGRMLLTGGGAKNKFLVERLFYHIPHIQIVIPNDSLVQYKEALIFAFLGCLRINNQINCLRTVTGSACDHVAGVVYQRTPVHEG
ncbi:MAG: anhydro-N-acetylmuramic acid kinase [Bacteroidales bacterium]|jgi:anhydro-N-acetylmuramic acid kinase|nr:anhydro-N-acetylmuramic acid kinase [Bacteroidales bacterium]